MERTDTSVPSTDEASEYIRKYLEAVYLGLSQQPDLAMEKVEQMRAEGEKYIEGLRLEPLDRLASAIYLESGDVDNALSSLQRRELVSSVDFLFHFYNEDFLHKEIAFRSALDHWPLDENLHQAVVKMHERDWEGAIDLLTRKHSSNSAYDHLLLSCYARNGDFEKAFEMNSKEEASNYKMIVDSLLKAMSDPAKNERPLELIKQWVIEQLPPYSG